MGHTHPHSLTLSHTQHTHIYSVVLVLVLAFLARLLLDFGIPKVSILDYSFSFGICVVKLTFDLKCIAILNRPHFEIHENYINFCLALSIRVSSIYVPKFSPLIKAFQMGILHILQIL